MTRSILMYERPYHDETGRRFLLQYYLLIDEVISAATAWKFMGRRRYYSKGIRSWIKRPFEV